MKKAVLLGSFVLLSSIVAAQDDGQVKVSPATKRYHAYRTEVTEPSYGLAKVKASIKKIKPDKDDNEYLPKGEFERLSTREKFTYCMLHGEDMSQNCDMMPWVVEEEKKVFAYPPPFNDGNELWSDRQKAFMMKNRGTVIQLLRSTMHAKHRVGANLKAAIIELDATPLIPDLISEYKRDRKDQDILTVLMLLMKNGKYKPFEESATYKKLYADDASYKAFILANDANQKLMFERAMAFYRTHRK